MFLNEKQIPLQAEKDDLHFDEIQIPLQAGRDDLYLNEMQIPLQAETDDLYQRCANFDNVAKEANATSDRMDAEIRDLSKKVSRARLTLKIMRYEIEKMPRSETFQRRSRILLVQKFFTDSNAGAKV